MILKLGIPKSANLSGMYYDSEAKNYLETHLINLNGIILLELEPTTKKFAKRPKLHIGNT